MTDKIHKQLFYKIVVLTNYLLDARGSLFVNFHYYHSIDQSILFFVPVQPSLMVAGHNKASPV